MLRLIRYGKKVTLAIVLTFVVAVTGILSTSFDSQASEMNKGLVFDLNYAEPTTSSTQGYISLLIRHNTTGVHYVSTFFWNMVATSSGNSAPCYAYLDVFSNGVKINIGGSSGVTGAFLSVFNYGPTGNLWYLHGSNNSPYEWRTSDYSVIDYRYKGNVGSVTSQFGSGTNKFTIYFNEEASARLLGDVWDILHAIYQQDSSIGDTILSIYNSVDGVENQLSSVVHYIHSVDDRLIYMTQQLRDIYSKMDELLNEQQVSNTWLEKIWNSIQEFINPKDDDSEKTDQFTEESNAQKSEIDALNEQNQVEKVDVDSAAAQVDSNINYDNMAEYGGVLATVTNNSYVLQMILVVVSIAVIAYVLFGKR